MVCDDLISNFYHPIFLSNILDVNRIDSNIINELMKGLYNVAKKNNIIISGGEIAELGERVNGYGKSMNFNWAATAIGFKLLKGYTEEKIKKGDYVYAFKSSGFRSNGFSLARKILKDTYGDNWHKIKYNEEITWGELMLTPSKIYFTEVLNLIENGAAIKKIAHITGGGFINNTKRILPENLNIKITNPIETPKYFKKLIEIGNISLHQAEITWNMGYGMILSTKNRLNYKLFNDNLQYIGEII